MHRHGADTTLPLMPGACQGRIHVRHVSNMDAPVGPVSVHQRGGATRPSPSHSRIDWRWWWKKGKREIGKGGTRQWWPQFAMTRCPTARQRRADIYVLLQGLPQGPREVELHDHRPRTCGSTWTGGGRRKRERGRRPGEVEEGGEGDRETGDRGREMGYLPSLDGKGNDDALGGGTAVPGREMALGLPGIAERGSIGFCGGFRASKHGEERADGGLQWV